MRTESSVTTLSWIPQEAVSGYMKLGFSTGLSHYDAPPPATLTDLDALRDADAFRFANTLSAWAEFDGDKVVDCGQGGGVVMGSTTVRMAGMDATFAAVPMPDLKPEPVIGDGTVTFTQTVGGRTALPLPRRVTRAPFVRLSAPLVWTTLKLTLRADGTADFELAGASPFPRHWVYDASGELAAKAGLTDWAGWVGQPSWTDTPWGDQDSPVVVAAAESALEREMSALLMTGARKPKIRNYGAGDVIAAQGSPGSSLMLVLDGIVDIDVDGRSLGDLGPGAILGEHAVLQQSPRTATVTAKTAVRTAEAPGETIDRAALTDLARGHRREW